MDPYRLAILTAVGAVSIGFALAVYLRNTRNEANRSFSLAVVASQFWLALAFMSDQRVFAPYALLLNRLTVASGVIMGVALVHLALVFPRPRGRLAAGWRAFLLAGSVIAALTAVTPLVISDVTFRPGGTDLVPGPLLAVMGGYLVMGIAAIVFTLARKIRRAEGRERAQLLFLMLGLALFCIADLTFGLFLPLVLGSYAVSALNSFAPLLLIGFTSYAMIKYRLMDMRLVVLRSVMYALLLGGLGAVITALAFMARLRATEFGIGPDAMFVTSCLAAVLVFQPARQRLEATTDQVFYRLTYDPDAVLSGLGASMASTLSLGLLSDLLAGELRERLRLVFAAVVYREMDAVKVASVGEVLDPADARPLLEAAASGPVLILDEMDPDEPVAREMTRRGVRVSAPLVVEGTVRGALLLGPKRSGGMFSAQDARFIEVLVSEAAIAFRNAELFDEVNHRVGELTALNDLATSLGANVELQAVLDTAMGEIVDVTDAETGSIMLLGDDARLAVAAARGMPADIVAETSVPMGEGIAGLVAESRHALLLPNEADPRLDGTLLRDEIRSAISAPLVAKGRVIGVVNVSRKESPRPFTKENLRVVTSFAGQIAIAIENARLYSDLESTLIGTISALAATVDAKDPYTYGHSTEVTLWATAIAETLGVSEQALRDIQIAAILHDIGKIGIAGAILAKPAALTPEERAVIATHPRIAADILAPLTFMRDAIPSILSHHERYEGGGYPSGIEGADIPLGARIIAVADSFNAMTSDRPYRGAMPVETATAELEACSGTQFDPEVVQAFMQVFSQGGPEPKPQPTMLLPLERYRDEDGPRSGG